VADPVSSPAWQRLIALVAAFAGMIGVLLGAIRPWYTGWGASSTEQVATLPGDSFSPQGPRETRGISIAAPADHVFAWVSQLGQSRAGFYSYELLEDLAGCEMPSRGELDPALQRWEPGDKLWMYPPDKLDGMGHATLLEYQPGRALIFGTRSPLDAPEAGFSGTWSFIVSPTGEQSSRLIVRGSGTPPPNMLGVAFNRAVFEPMHFAMERRMLEGIRGLAEGRPISRLHDYPMLALWSLTFGTFIAAGVLVLTGVSWRRSLGAFVAAGVVFQILTLAQPSLLLAIPLVIALILFAGVPALSSSHGAPKLLDSSCHE
jgi:hypothetical protein